MLAVGKKKPAKDRAFDGVKLRELRGDASLTLAKLAEMAGISAADLSRYERGLVVPSFDVACRLADALGIGVAELRGARG